MARRNSDAVRAKEKNSGFGLWLNSDDKSKAAILEILKQMDEEKSKWSGLLAIPPGSFIEAVVSTFSKETSIAIQLPAMMSFVYISSFLCQNNVRVELDKDLKWPTLWICLLAESGGAKTFTLKFLQKVLDKENKLNVIKSFSSSKEFIDLLVETPNCLLLQDEFGPFFKNIKEQSYLAETNKYLLDAYGNEKLTRNTGGVKREVEEPVLNILGTTATSSFFEDFDPTNFVNGLAQRFLFVRTDKPEKQKPLWKVRQDVYTNEISDRWSRTCGLVKPNTVYKIKDYGRAEIAFDIAYTAIESKVELGDDFLRRIMFAAAISYSVIYHVLLGKADEEYIDEEDIAWAARLAYLHANEAKTILELAGGGKLRQLIDKAEALALRIKEKENRSITARDLARNLNAVKTTAEAKQLLSLLDLSRIG